jgi:glutathione synthase/RimK-type ligase-like ATP-grasp enzyme
LTIARQMGFLVPDTLVTNQSALAKDFFHKHSGLIVMKTITTLYYDDSEGVRSASYTTRVTPEIVANFEQLALCPMMFQEEILKTYELRITLIGEEVFAAKINSAAFPNQEVDWRVGSLISFPWEKCEIPDWLSLKCKDMIKHYGLSYGAFDFALSPNGEHVFFELNPNGQWGWIEVSTGMPMTEALLKTLGCI